MVYLRIHGKTYEEMVLEQQQHDLHLRALARLGQGSVGGPDAARQAGVQ